MTKTKSYDDAVDEVNDYYKTWTGMLTSRSLELSFAIIAANWAVHNNANAILNNFWARLSILIILLFFGANLTISYIIGELLRICCSDAAKNPERWKQEFENPDIRPPFWPYTKYIVKLGLYLRIIKLLAPVIAFFCFLLSLFFIETT